MKQSLRDYLYTYFKYKTFQIGQEEIITDILNGNDVLGVLPTGSGKSLCYQLPAKLLSGLTIVVSPLISLMVDQVRRVRAFYYKEVVALHSFQNWKERRRILNQLHLYKLVYVSPELLQQENFLNRLQQIRVGLFVIDEAHCISQWGYDFRPDYLRLNNVISKLNHPTILALTGTATPEVQKDIMDRLDRPRMKRHIYPMDRENITLVVQHVDGGEEDKQNMLLSLVSTHHQPTIIYFSSRKITEHIAFELSYRLPDKRIAFYHGGMENIDRLKIQQQFMNDQIDIICCTSAFGMGIDKKNIRLVIHYHMPPELESFIQEIGRAGRDGEESVSVLLYRKGDEQVPLQIIEHELPTEQEINSVIKKLYILFLKNEPIPADEEAIEQLFDLTITKWRFLHYQFETHGMMERNNIFYNKNSWAQALRMITQFCEERKILKKQRLKDMVRWLQSKNCLREELYKNFQPTIRKKDAQCCSNCGFSLTSWERTKTRKKLVNNHDTWKEQLANLLLVGDHP